MFSPGETSEISLIDPLLKEIQCADDPGAMGSRGREIDLEGISNYAGANPPYRAYTQVQRSGAVEAVRELTQDLRTVKVDVGEVPEEIEVIFADFYEPLIVQAVQRFLDLIAKLVVPFPVFMFLSLVEVNGYRILARQQIERRGSSGLFIHVDDLKGHPISCDDLLLPPSTINDTGFEKIENLTHHALEMVWNASGVATALACPNKRVRPR